MKKLLIKLNYSLIMLAITVVIKCAETVSAADIIENNKIENVNAPENDEEIELNENRKITDYVLNANIEVSKIPWAIDSIKSPQCPWFSSMKNLKELIAVYVTESKLTDDESSRRHNARVNQLFGYIYKVLELDTNKELDIKQWQETDYGKLALGYLNAIMVCESLHVMHNRIDAMGDYFYSLVYRYMEFHSRFRELRSLTFLQSGDKRLIWDKICAHFKNDSGNMLEEYLKHDFNVYLKNIGIITNIINNDKIIATSVIDEIKKATELKNEVISKINKYRKSQLEIQEILNNFTEQVLKYLKDNFGKKLNKDFCYLKVCDACLDYIENNIGTTGNKFDKKQVKQSLKRLLLLWKACIADMKKNNAIENDIDSFISAFRLTASILANCDKPENKRTKSLNITSVLKELYGKLVANNIKLNKASESTYLDYVDAIFIITNEVNINEYFNGFIQKTKLKDTSWNPAMIDIPVLKIYFDRNFPILVKELLVHELDRSGSAYAWNCEQKCQKNEIFDLATTLMAKMWSDASIYQKKGNSNMDVATPTIADEFIRILSDFNKLLKSKGMRPYINIDCCLRILNSVLDPVPVLSKYYKIYGNWVKKYLKQKEVCKQEAFNTYFKYIVHNLAQYCCSDNSAYTGWHYSKWSLLTNREQLNLDIIYDAALLILLTYSRAIELQDAKTSVYVDLEDSILEELKYKNKIRHSGLSLLTGNSIFWQLIGKDVKRNLYLTEKNPKIDTYGAPPPAIGNIKSGSHPYVSQKHNYSPHYHEQLPWNQYWSQYRNNWHKPSNHQYLNNYQNETYRYPARYGHNDFQYQGRAQNNKKP